MPLLKDDMSSRCETAFTRRKLISRFFGFATLASVRGETRAAPSAMIYANDAPYAAAANGITDDTSKLKAVMEAAMAANKTVVLKGSYKVSDSLITNRIRKQGNLHIHLDGDVIITVDADAKQFDTLIYLMSEAKVDSNFTGGSLTLNLNHRCANGLVVRSLSKQPGGEIQWTASVRVFDAFNDLRNETTDNFGIAIMGPYQKIRLSRPRVERIGRARSSGESKAIAIVGYVGRVDIESPYLDTATAPSDAFDVDLLALFPALNGKDPFKRRTGLAYVSNGLFKDCQGRSIKLQGRAILSGNKYIRSGKVTSIRESCEVDAQFDELLESGASYQYDIANGRKSPVGEHHVLISVQHLINDANPRTVVKNATLSSNIPIWAAVSVNFLPNSASSSIKVSDLTINSDSRSRTGIFMQSVLLFDADKLIHINGSFFASLSHISGFIDAPLIGYSATSTAFFRKLRIEMESCSNSGRTFPAITAVGGRMDLPAPSAKRRQIAGWS